MAARSLAASGCLAGVLASRRSLASAANGQAGRRDPLAVATTPPGQLRHEYDAIVVGGGHNGLIAAAYLARAKRRVLVLERRPVVGGAAVTEEIVPGFRFSRASYLLSLLRPAIVEDLQLKRHGLNVYLRPHSSFTPKRDGSDYLLMGRDQAATQKEIAKFSKRDAEVYSEYEATLDRYVHIVEPLLDMPPIDFSDGIGSLISLATRLVGRGRGISLADIPGLYELMTAPAARILDRWFESDILKATLATDAVIGAVTSPYNPGSGYVLLHHVMGEIEGHRGVWAYAEGGMGAVSAAIARSALSEAAHIAVNAQAPQPVKQVLVERDRVTGVELTDGTQFKAPVVLSNATPKVTFLDLVSPEHLPQSFLRSVQNIDYESGTFKINVAMRELPSFVAAPSPPGSTAPQAHHQGTIHFEEHQQELHQADAVTTTAYLDSKQGRLSERPIIEMCIPSVLDPTLAPPGQHVVTLFVQYAPYNLASGSWKDGTLKEKFADHVFRIIDHYAPNFSSSVIGRDVLSPWDLEQVFGLTGGNIFHGSMGLHQLYYSRPVASACGYTTPLAGYYLCGSGAHPGGGVMGAAGRNAAAVALRYRQ